MPYINISLGPHVSKELADFIRNFDYFFSEFRFLLTIQGPRSGPGGNFQMPLGILILSAADGAAQLLYPKNNLTNRERFTGFLRDCYPWNLDRPEGIAIEESCNYLWEQVRCSLVHRLGSTTTTKTNPLRISLLRGQPRKDEELIYFENSIGERPTSQPAILKNGTGEIIVHIDQFYWGLRIAITRALDTPDKCREVEAWIKSGKWDPS